MKKGLKIFLIAIAIFLLTQRLPTISFSQSATTLTCRVVQGLVYDGDSMCVICQSQPVEIRFACTDAPEKDQPMGIASRDHLQSLLNRARNQVTITPITTDYYDRIIAEVYASHQLVQLEQVKNGMVWANKRNKSDCPHWNDIEKAFNEARSQKRGIFAQDVPVPPWIWRQRQ